VVVSELALSRMFASVRPLLDERQRRVLAGAQARALGRGGIGVVARAADMSRTTVQKAVAEVDGGIEAAGPIRITRITSGDARDAAPGGNAVRCSGLGANRLAT